MIQIDRELIFVYNADASLFAQMTDYVHKVVSPDTYRCNLCKITYGLFAMKKEWKDMLDSLALPVHFLHRDEFYNMYAEYSDHDLPAVFLKTNTGIQEILSTDDINKQHTVAELKLLVRGAVAQI